MTYSQFNINYVTVILGLLLVFFYSLLYHGWASNTYVYIYKLMFLFRTGFF